MRARAIMPIILQYIWTQLIVMQIMLSLLRQLRYAGKHNKTLLYCNHLPEFHADKRRY